MYLSKNFTLAEMTISQEAIRRGIPNTPSQTEIQNLQRLCNTVLEPLRAHFGAPVTVTSGFRSKAVNSLVGGSKDSDHCRGRAADIHVNGKTPLEVCEAIDKLGLPYRQVINEFGRWTHVSIAEDGEEPKREKLTAKKDAQGRTFYLKGLV